MARTSSNLDRAARFYEHCVTPIVDQEESFFHQHWSARRSLVRAALARNGANTFALDRFDNCGSDAFVFWSEARQQHKIGANFCRSRHCEVCARRRARLVAANLRSRLARQAQGRYRFITLTIKHSDHPLIDQVKRLYASFRKLRTWALWKTQKGGAFVLEVKIGRDDKWHPHLHIVSEGYFIAQRELSAAWHQITGDSISVDVRGVDQADELASELCKYMSKGTSVCVWQDQARADEWIIASRGIRTCATFGTWRSFRLLDPPASDDDWRPVARLVDVLAAGRRAEPWALRILDECCPGPKKSQAP